MTNFKLSYFLIKKIEELKKNNVVKISIGEHTNYRGALLSQENCLLISVSNIYNQSDEMKNWTIAHEIGHFELNHAPLMFCYEDAMCSVIPEEIAANNYAAELLLPQNLLQLHFEAISRMPYSEQQKLYHLKTCFGVSYEVLKYRLDKLNLMKRSEFESCFN